MITVTLGTTSYPFDRLLYWLRILIEKNIISEPLFVQYGLSKIEHLSDKKLVTAAALIPYDSLADKIDKSRLVISHAGDGTTRKLAKQNKSFVVIPRTARLGEHVDDHQVSFAEEVKHMGVKVCKTLDELELAILRPPRPLNRDLFEGAKLSSYLATKYPANYCY